MVADFNAGWMARYNDMFDAELTPDLVQFWDGPHRLTHFADMAAFWQWASEHDGHSFFRHLEPYPDALATLHALVADGHDIVIVTAKPAWAVHDTLEWLADHRVPTREIHLLDHTGNHDKSRVDCDVYLDDSPHVLPNLVTERPARTVCRFVRPWNVAVDGARDVHDWGEFHATVHAIEHAMA